jgi:tetratricopeptide (TPR) repeat protein
MNAMPNAPHSHVRAYIWLLVILLLLIGLGYAVVTFFTPASSNTSQQYLEQSNAAFNSNDFASAINDANTVLAKDPNNVQALIAKASALAQEGSLTFQEQTYGAQAIAVAEQALTIDPQNPDAWRIIGYANEIMQNYPAAQLAYQQSLAIDPQNAQTLSQQAHAYDLQGNIAQAEAGYKAALAIDPTLDQAQMGLGRTLMDQNDLTDALAAFEAAGNSTQNVRVRAEAAYSIGVIESMRGDLSGAAASMGLATTSDPTYPLAWTGLGSIEFAQAIATSSALTLEERNTLITSSFEDLQHALQINPNQSEALFLLGSELAGVGQNASAVQVLQQAEKAAPNDITLNASDKTSMLTRIKAVLATISSSK